MTYKGKNIINSSDDMTAHFLDKIVLKSSYNNMIFRYSFKKEFGKGYIERVLINENIEIWISNLYLYSDEVIYYDMPHNIFEISCCIKGKCVNHFTDCDKAINIEGGNVFVFAGKNMAGYSEYPKNTNYQSMSIMTNKEYVLSLINKYNDCSCNSWGQLDQVKIHELCLGRRINDKEIKLVNEIISCKMDMLPRMIYLNAKAHEFISLKIDEFKINKEEMEMKSNKLSDYDMAKLDMVKSILLASMAKPPTIDEIAKAVGINSTKLKKIFKLAFDTTIYGYLRDRRLEYSKKKLYDKELTIAEIANEIGYSNPSKFAKAFKAKYGVNPKDIRHSYIYI